MGVHVLPARRTSLDSYRNLAFGDPIAVANVHVPTFIQCERLAFAMIMIINHAKVCASIF